MTQGDGFQSQATIQGAAFEGQARQYLQFLRFDLRGKRTFTDIGCEVDDAAVSPRGGSVYFEYKGSFSGTRPGLRRTDTVKKALLTGFLLRSKGDVTPYVVLTSHLPERGAGKAMIDAALESGAVHAVLLINDPSSTEILRAI